MFEKVNPSHPDKIADRIAGAIVDRAYMIDYEPKIAVEVLIGHGTCLIIIESNIPYELLDEYVKPDGEYTNGFISNTVHRITGLDNININIKCVPQDVHLAGNQSNLIRCGDNGIFLGVRDTEEQRKLTEISNIIYKEFPYDGKYLIDMDSKWITICQSHMDPNWDELINVMIGKYCDISEYNIVINPLGRWTGGINVDSGATNRKLGSDMGGGITGGGLHGKDLSKADVSINIFSWLMVNEPSYIIRNGGELCVYKDINDISFMCTIGDEFVGGYSYKFITKVARDYIGRIGGFEKFAEWGLIRPTNK